MRDPECHLLPRVTIRRFPCVWSVYADVHTSWILANKSHHGCVDAVRLSGFCVASTVGELSPGMVLARKVSGSL